MKAPAVAKGLIAFVLGLSLVSSQAPAAMASIANSSTMSASSEDAPTGGSAPVTENVSNEAPCKNDFTDVSPSDTFYNAVTWMACKGITNGYVNGSYGRNKSITRGEVASFLYRYSREQHSPGTTRDFKDVKPGSSHFAAISWMKAKGYTNGYTDGSYGLNKAISRGELAAFMYRFAGEDSYKAPTKSPFKDMTTKTSFYEPITWLKATGVIKGYVDNTFKPRRAVTRGESSQYFYALETTLHGKPSPPRVQPKPVPKSKGTQWTKSVVKVYSNTRDSKSNFTTLPAQTSVSVLTSAGALAQIRKGDTIGWVTESLLSEGKPGTTSKPYSKPKNWGQVAANNVAPWCWKVPTSYESGLGGRAGFRVSGSGTTRIATEWMILRTGWPADFAGSKAVQLHECAHILQYRAYEYDYAALTKAMNKVYPNNGKGIVKSKYASGVEHMADCIAIAMGSKRTGPTYYTGYHGSCNSSQMAAAKKIIAGKRV